MRFRLMSAKLGSIRSPDDLRKLSGEQLVQIAAEMRDALCEVVTSRTAHFASNLGVVELCLALHTVFDFRHDRLIWDTGHQIYPHKLVTGRYDQFDTIRTRGGLMGYPNPAESEFDLFMTGHAGSSISTLLGLKTGDDLAASLEAETPAAQNGRALAPRCHVAVIGDGAFPSGIVFEALNNAGGLKKRLLVILNDNKMSICPRVGALAQHLDKLRTNPLYTGLKTEIQRVLNHVPVVGDSVERFLSQVKDSIKAGLHGGMLFEELGFDYVGPVDGHDIAKLQKYLRMVKDIDRPVLLHVLTEKGHGYQPAAADPVYFHTPPALQRDRQGPPPLAKPAQRSYTTVVSEALHACMAADRRVTVMTAAMCQGNQLEQIRADFPARFFDVGICESHAVAFAAGQAKAGLRPVVDVYSTFLQRSFDQIFQEVALQNLPVTFLLDRAGLTGPDGPTHHGAFDLGYMRLFPNMTVLAPGDEADIEPMLRFALAHEGPVSIRYPKAKAERIARAPAPLAMGRAEVLRRGADGVLIACGTLLAECVRAAEMLCDGDLDIGVINARFVKPLDRDTLLRALDEAPFAITVEEAALHTGFGSAVLEAAADAGVDATCVRRLGLPDRFIEHGERGELLADLGLDAPRIAATAHRLAQSFHRASQVVPAATRPASVRS